MSEPLAKAIALCNYASQGISGRWSLIDIFEKVNLPSVPAKAPPFYVFARIADCPKVAKYTFQVEDPTGLVIWTSGPQVMERSAAIESAGWDLVWAIPSLTVNEFGKHRVVTMVNADRVAETDLIIAALQGNPAPRPVP